MISVSAFLGITRELVRGGQPEIFFAADMLINKRNVDRLLARDQESKLLSVPFGLLGRADGVAASKTPFKRILRAVTKDRAAPISVPLLTNLLLWHGGARSAM